MSDGTGCCSENSDCQSGAQRNMYWISSTGASFKIQEEDWIQDNPASNPQIAGKDSGNQPFDNQSYRERRLLRYEFLLQFFLGFSHTRQISSGQYSRISGWIAEDVPSTM